MYPELKASGPGVGPGWRRLAQAVREQRSLDTLDGLWVFQPLRIEKKEWGTAILAFLEEGRYQIVTAQYAHTIKGRDRGAFTAELKDVGSGPVEALDALVAGVPKRTEEDPPVRIPLETWYGPEEEDGPPQSG